MAKQSEIWSAIDARCLDSILPEIKKEADKIIEQLDDEPWCTFFNTFALITDQGFNFLPSGDYSGLRHLTIDWMRFGLIAGKSPEILRDILKRTRAKTIELGPMNYD
jgi:hypothetical protein